MTEGLQSPRGLALDAEGGKLYWTDSGTGKIQRANLDGSEVEDLVTEGLLSPRGLVLVRTVAGGNRAPVLAPIADRTAAAGDTLTLELVGSDPDGDALTYTVVSGNEEVATVEVADSRLTVYPLSSGRATIAVTVGDPDGLEAVQTFSVTIGAAGLGAVNRLYWTDAEADRIRRATPGRLRSGGRRRQRPGQPARPGRGPDRRQALLDRLRQRPHPAGQPRRLRNRGPGHRRPAHPPGSGPRRGRGQALLDRQRHRPHSAVQSRRLSRSRTW